ncbi:hypothetical protein KR018_005854 [Drosophila ironensis]|nr:hypothetical protein KR018_005854 [Drosophila ironensis]
MRLLKELMRMATQHRALYCYVLLSIWIFLLIAGMYRYMGNVESISGGGSVFGPSSSGSVSSLGGDAAASSSTAQRFARYRARCAPLSQLQRIDDGGILEGWKLQGVLMVIRHGDRGPISHVRSAGIDCGVSGGSDNLVNRYRSFLYNSSSSVSGSNHMYWNKVGPFHGFPLLPATEHGCPLGQLTYKGISQLLHVGEIIHQVYAHPLGLLARPNSNRASVETTPHTLLNSDEVVVFITRYRRTFQSALAMLFSLLPADKWLALNVQESHSMSFCFTECSCSQAALLRKRLDAMGDRQLLNRSDVLGAMKWIGGTLMQHTPNGITNPFEVVDALLTVLCHEAALPCRRKKRLPTPKQAKKNPNPELVDVINIDQDETAANPVQASAENYKLNAFYSYSLESALQEAQNQQDPDSPEAENGNPLAQAEGEPQEGCVEPAHVDTLIAFADEMSHRSAGHSNYKLSGLLRAYGMIRHIVSYMLKMISGDRTKFVLYSGHDCTMQYLTAALGIITGQGQTIAYASRLAFEVYRSEAHTDYYFRVVYNGRDVTQQIAFCEGGKSLRVTRDSRGNKADLCPIENIIRFLHEDYFSPLNATNFKEACEAVGPPKPGEF